jgi:hypothetical protein
MILFTNSFKHMAKDIYKANGVDLKIKRKENKGVDDKAIDIIMDLFPTASRRDKHERD